MIALRPMRDDEFPAYLDYFIPDYAAEIAANYRLSDAAALTQAKGEIEAGLPDGVATAGQVLLSIVDLSGPDETLVGYLWYKPDMALRSVFIADFHILAAHQGQGLGKRAMALLESDLRAGGFTQIKLRVAGDNDRARHVYEVSGFRVTGINMSKTLGEG
ncbi:putative N-acetyltransferase YycN [Pleomorphomonas sp. T1.2MG-36]|uniref:GNAT family N-acetyltransferase n=1 Tax=Pleomorphomonas sp. T1.2MG-36 TaxID=3041167 RepID=UPI0024776858|nr:GNAT family N-acetyltransferase [Pleomorphomonas sp. T1.2MG-36]CAI9403785.1 putative N-acetyltransferase YycN [Pleomorphomonas sp. T1.2MG-36]